MPEKSPRLAKLTAPSTVGLVKRPRLFEALDALRHGRFGWISGPGGAGKTSLVASWLADRKLAHVWYQVDTGDRDPATLFHYLGIAAPRVRSRRVRPLPHFTPEYLAGLTDFSRQYFQDFFGRFTAPTVLVFDSCHEAGADTPFQQIVSCALNEAPLGITVLCTSRAEPGEMFARRTVEPGYVHLRWEDLRLEESEALQIARQRGYGENEIRPLLPTVRGWAAGLVLTLRARRQGVSASLPRENAQQAVFDYFATEVIAAVEPEQRDFLLQAAVLPNIDPAVAAELTSYPHAAAFLEELHRNHFFTERHATSAGTPTYEFHPLFREFLTTRARTLGVEIYAALCRRGGDLLEQRHQYEAAVALRTAPCDWPGLARTICGQAPTLMEQGRWQTLAEWISALPEEVLRDVPWLTYWRGVCCCMTDPFAAPAQFEAAYRQFQAMSDTIGSLLACAGILEAYYLQLSDQTPALPWIDEFDRLLSDCPTLPREIELRVIQGMMGVWMAQPQHPMLLPWTRRSIQLLRTLSDPRERVGVLALVTGYCVWAGQYPMIRAVLDEIEFDARTAEAAPLNAIAACVFKAGVAWQDAEHEAAYELVALARTFAENSGVHVLDPFIAAQELYTATSAMDIVRSRAALTRIQSQLDSRRKLDLNQHESLHAMVLLGEGKLAEALTVLQHLVPETHALGAPFVIAGTSLEYAQMLLLDEQYEAAQEHISQVLSFARAMPSLILQFQALLSSAYGWFRVGDEHRGYEALRDGLEIGRRQIFMNCHPIWIPKIMSFVLSRALEAGIEPDYVRRFIRHRQLEPDSPEVPGWPWPLRVYTLGPFRVLKGDEPLKAGRKAPRRVLELLQAVVALGCRDANRDRLTEALWPEAEGDAARDAFEIALHRLRKLIGEDAVLLEHGRVSLSAKHVWIDIEAFERLADEVLRSRDTDANKPRLARALDKALTLYGGHFLGTEPERPWLLPTRERARSKLERLVLYTGGFFEKTGRVGEATTLYQRALELHPLGEAFYRRLMACHVRANETAAALDVYRRCRQMLSVVLGVSPSAETEALRATISD
jgi:ATP/maltotriose-dependent transcriptional regulator MalT/DNA-binding SARP family transcriptional activator